MRSLAVKLACFLLKLNLNIQQRTKLVGAILDTNNAVPLRDIITFQEDGSMYIRGERIDHEKAVKLREGALMALDNYTRAIVLEQVASVAGRRGVAEGDTPEKLYFYRAALWWGMLEQEILEKLAQR